MLASQKRKHLKIRTIKVSNPKYQEEEAEANRIQNKKNFYLSLYQNRNRREIILAHRTTASKKKMGWGHPQKIPLNRQSKQSKNYQRHRRKDNRERIAGQGAKERRKVPLLYQPNKTVLPEKGRIRKLQSKAGIGDD